MDLLTPADSSLDWEDVSESSIISVDPLDQITVIRDALNLKHGGTTRGMSGNERRILRNARVQLNSNLQVAQESCALPLTGRLQVCQVNVQGAIEGRKSGQGPIKGNRIRLDTILR